MKSNGTNITETKTTRNEAPKQKRGGGGGEKVQEEAAQHWLQKRITRNTIT